MADIGRQTGPMEPPAMGNGDPPYGCSELLSAARSFRLSTALIGGRRQSSPANVVTCCCQHSFLPTRLAWQSAGYVRPQLSGRMQRGSFGLRAVALGQFLAGLAHWHAGARGGGADVSDCGIQGVLPEVVGLPLGDLLQQVGLGSAAPRRRCQESRTEACGSAGRGRRTRAGTGPASLPGPGDRRGWPRTSPARRRRGEGRLRRGRYRCGDAGNATPSGLAEARFLRAPAVRLQAC